MINRNAKPRGALYVNGPLIRINGDLYSWAEVDPERAAAFEALSFAADRAARLERDLRREADKHVESTRREWEDRK